MNKFISVMILAIGLTGCAHHHKKTAHHHHKKEKCGENCKMRKQEAQFDKHCALSVSERDPHVHGKDEFRLKHGGKVYFFSSEENLNKFQENLEENISKANKNWSNYRGNTL